MRNTTKFIIGATLAAASAAQGAITVLTFEGLQNLEPINSFYDGGLGGFGSGPGPNFGIQFNNTSLAIIDADAGGTGNIGGEPTPDTVLFFLQASAVMNVPAGFDTGFSFFYSAVNSPGVVTVWDDLGGSTGGGNLLATINLPLTPHTGAPDPTGNFSPFRPVGAAFNGIAKSIDFGGTGNQIAYDNVTFGSKDPVVPEASTVVSMLGLGAIAGSVAWRRRQAAKA